MSGEEEINPYQSPSGPDEGRKPWDLEVNASLPLQVTIIVSATLYRRFRLSGWVDADLAWDGMHRLVTCNGREFSLGRKRMGSFVVTSIEFGSHDSPYVLTVESSTTWFYLVRALRVSINGTVIYSEGEF